MKKINIKETQASIQKKKKIKLISLIAFITFLSIWLFGWIIFAFNMELGEKILLVTSLIISIPVALYMIAMYIILMFHILHHLFKSNKWLTKIGATLAIINIALFILGVVILFLGAPFEDKYMIEKVKVLDIRENKILIDDSINNHGDTRIIEINKPFYAHIKEGDTISVRYPSNKREKMYYVIDLEIGENLLGISVILFMILMSTHVTISIVSSLKSKK